MQVDTFNLEILEIEQAPSVDRVNYAFLDLDSFSNTVLNRFPNDRFAALSRYSVLKLKGKLVHSIPCDFDTLSNCHTQGPKFFKISAQELRLLNRSLSENYSISISSSTPLLINVKSMKGRKFSTNNMLVPAWKKSCLGPKSRIESLWFLQDDQGSAADFLQFSPLDVGCKKSSSRLKISYITPSI
jgi:hypothetical protein